MRRVDNAIGLAVFPTARVLSSPYDSLFSQPALEYDAQPNLRFPVG